LIAFGNRLHASKSPLELAAKPASITSTFRRSSWRAMRSFSSRVMEAPGDCSPSRKVVSKMMSLSAMGLLLLNGVKVPQREIPGRTKQKARCGCKRAFEGKSARALPSPPVRR
jgi:hypothetical protein